MWTTPLSPTGNLPATHWISTGQIGDDFAAIMPFSHGGEGVWVQDQTTLKTKLVRAWITEPYSAAAFVALAEAAGIAAPPVEAIEQIMSMVDVSDQDAFTAMARLNLQLCTRPLE